MSYPTEGGSAAVATATLYVSVPRDLPRTVRNIASVSAPLTIQFSSEHPVTPKKEVCNA